jgi:hypothetical protein
MKTLQILKYLLIFSVSMDINAGAWGYGPRDSDAGYSLQLKLLASKAPLQFITEIVETYGEGYEAEVRFACDFLINELGDKYESDYLVNECISVVQSYYNDPDYLEAWEDNDAIKNALMLQIIQLRAHNK